VDGDRPQHVRSVEARLTLTLANWVIAELERHSTDHPGETLDGFVSEQIRRWAEQRSAERLRTEVPALRPRHASSLAPNVRPVG
jgi:hypothetical protein